MKVQIEFDDDDIKLIAKNAEKFLVEKETEKPIAKLFQLRDQLDLAIEEAEKLMAEKALKLNPNFKSIEGDLIKASYRAYGQRYYIEDQHLGEVPKEMYTKEIITKYKVNSDVVDDYVADKGSLPFGIVAPERKKTLKIKLRKNDSTT